MKPVLGDRSLFPDLQVRSYLSHAAIAPPSLPVRRAVSEVLDSAARGGAEAFGGWLEQRTRLRGKVAGLLGASAADIAFVPNTSRGIADIALCFPWTKKDRVLSFEGEFPANVTPWQRVAGLFDLSVELLPALTRFVDVDAWLAQLADELGRQPVALVAVSAVQFQTGMRMPLERIAALCHQHDAQLFVDGIQACGIVPIDVRAMGIDYLSAGAHKWLMGVEGAGVLYVAPERIAALEPRVASWLSHEDGMAFLSQGEGKLRYDRPIRKRADFVEGGLWNAVGIAALEASVDGLTELGIDAIFEHVRGYLDALEQGLTSRGFASQRATSTAFQSGILSLRPPADVDVMALYRALDSAVVSCSTPDGLLRFAPHWPNDVAEVDAVLGAVDAALAAVRGGAARGHGASR